MLHTCVYVKQNERTTMMRPQQGEQYMRVMVFHNNDAYRSGTHVNHKGDIHKNNYFVICGDIEWTDRTSMPTTMETYRKLTYDHYKGCRIDIYANHTVHNETTLPKQNVFFPRKRQPRPVNNVRSSARNLMGTSSN